MVVGGDCFVLNIFSILVSMRGEVKEGRLGYRGLGIGDILSWRGSIARVGGRVSRGLMQP